MPPLHSEIEIPPNWSFGACEPWKTTYMQSIAKTLSARNFDESAYDLVLAYESIGTLNKLPLPIVALIKYRITHSK